MNSSLRDQLLAAGLVTEKQVRQLDQQERQRRIRSKSGSEAPRAPGSAHQTQTARTASDRELNRKQHEKAQRKARIARIEQMIERDRLPRLDSDDHYSFIDGKKIRRMAVDAARRAKLTGGELAIVRYKGHYAVVPAETARQIRELEESMVVPSVQPEAAEPDEAYKDFVVPDDLMW